MGPSDPLPLSLGIRSTWALTMYSAHKGSATKGPNLRAHTRIPSEKCFGVARVESRRVGFRGLGV